MFYEYYYILYHKKIYVPRRKQATITKLGTNVNWQGVCKWLKFWPQRDKALCAKDMRSWESLKAWILAQYGYSNKSKDLDGRDYRCIWNVLGGSVDSCQIVS